MNIAFHPFSLFLFICLIVSCVGCITANETKTSQNLSSHDCKHHSICTEGATSSSPEDLIPHENETPSLNDYGCSYDNFSTTIEIGKTYIYENQNTDIHSHFKILQVLSANTALAIRYAFRDYYCDGDTLIYEEVVFFIQSKSSYADGARLRAGKYLCTGIYQYETHNGIIKTVYALDEQK